MTFQTTYFPLLVLFVMTVGFLLVMLGLSVFVGPKRLSVIKDDPFECGTLGSGSANERFSVKYYLIAMIFILFDIEIVFLYPYTTQALQLGWAGYAAMLSFVTVLSLGLAYIWRRGVFNWT